MPAEYELNLESFSFPDALADNRANFRFVVDVRMVRGGRFATDTSVMPGLDTWWECDRKKPEHPHYVRLADHAGLDMSRLDAWERLVLLTRADSLHSVQVKVFDVDRRDPWDTLRDAFARVAQSVLGRAGRAVAAHDVGGEGFGAIEDDLRSTIAKRLAGGDRLLYRGAARVGAPGAISIAGRGVAGDYSIGLLFQRR